MEVEITRDLLMDAGGWKEMKAARSLHRQGLVSEARYEGGVLSGLVRDGGKPKKVRMAIRSRTDMENFCPCLRADQAASKRRLVGAYSQQGPLNEGPRTRVFPQTEGAGELATWCLGATPLVFLQLLADTLALQWG